MIQDEKAVIPLVRPERFKKADSERKQVKFSYHQDINDEDSAYIKKPVKVYTGLPDEDPVCFFDTLISYQDVMKRQEEWPGPLAYGNTEVPALFNGLESLLDGAALAQFQVIHRRQAYSSRLDTWKTFKEVVSAFILEYVCLGIERPYVVQRQYLQQRSFPAQLSVTTLWQIHQRINLILPYLLDIPTMKQVSNRERCDLNSLWVYGELSPFQWHEIWTTQAPQRWVLSLHKERENWETMEVTKIVNYYHQCEVAESQNKTVGDGRHFAAVRKGGGRQSIPYHQQHYEWSSAATNRRYQQRAASQHHAYSQGRSPQSGNNNPLPREGRQYQYNPSYQRSSYQQQQPQQQRPNNYQAPGGGRGAGMTGRGQYQGRGFQQQRQGFAGRQGGVSRRAPMRQEQFHHYEPEIPPEEEQQQYQPEGEVDYFEGQDDDAFAHEEGQAQDSFNMGQVEQTLDEVAEEKPAPADEEFLYEEDEWTGLGFDAPYYEDDDDEAERL